MALVKGVHLKKKEKAGNSLYNVVGHLEGKK
jgi:hypothetical protein